MTSLSYSVSKLLPAVQEKDMAIPDPPSNFVIPSDGDVVINKNTNNCGMQVDEMTEDPNQFVINEIMDLKSITDDLKRLSENQIVLYGEMRTLKTNIEKIMLQNVEIILLMKNGIATNNLDHGLQATRQDEESDNEDNLLPPMPFQSKKRYLRFDNELETNKNLRKQLKQKAAGLGGADARKVVHNILAAVMTNKVAKKFNWTGTGEKIAMNNKQLPKVIFNIVKKEYGIKVRLAEINGYIKRWLQKTGDRIRNEQKKVETQGLREQRMRELEAAALSDED